ncbi:MAG: hypothetical protein MUE33_08745 [Cytophagaceae bacterium]|jgi:hypothetical protein|nr:hypothetical protein [Cytophagaceae bacterium]
MNTNLLHRPTNLKYRNVLYLFLFLVVFDGLLRKLIPSLSTPIFFLKDILCFWIWVDYLLLNRYPLPKLLKRALVVLFLLLLPVFIRTALLDPYLALFGWKQYYLYSSLSLLMVKASIENERFIYDFILHTACIILPITLVAIYQQQLPSSHWLNQGIGGADLSGFSAAGKLRVSSTFSFTGQYSYFVLFLTTINLLKVSLKISWFSNTILQWVETILLLGLCVVSIFISGSRTAPLGTSLIVILSFILLLFQGITFKQLGRYLIFMLLGIVLLLTLKSNFTHFFEAFDQRFEDGNNKNELNERLISSFELNDQLDISFTDAILGRGIGVMSNGSDKISDYASLMRSNGFWTESDFQTTMWEGGYYLVFSWYLFRIGFVFLLIYYSFRRSTTTDRLSIVFIQGFILFLAGLATLGIQSILAISWWLGIGILLSLTMGYEKKA